MGGCLGDSVSGWIVEIANELPYSIHAVVEFQRNRKYDLEIIPPKEIVTVSESFVGISSSKEAHRGIRQISIFSEDKRPLMIFRGKGMNKYVVFIKKYDEWDYLFRLEVKEEYIGIGLNNRGIEIEGDEEKPEDILF